MALLTDQEFDELAREFSLTPLDKALAGSLLCDGFPIEQVAAHYGVTVQYAQRREKHFRDLAGLSMYGEVHPSADFLLTNVPICLRAQVAEGAARYIASLMAAMPPRGPAIRKEGQPSRVAPRRLGEKRTAPRPITPPTESVVKPEGWPDGAPGPAWGEYKPS